MDNHFFLNVQFDSTNPTSIPTWQQFSNSTMEIQSPDFFLNSNSDPHPSFHFDSALSSPAVSNSNPSNESFVIRELIGKLGSIGSSNSHQNFPRKENLSSVRKSMALNSSVGEFSTDPGFAERAARLSCFGSKSFNYRSNSLIINDEKLSRVSSSPSLKILGSEKGYCENMNSPSSPSRDRNELTNSQDESTLSEQNNHPNLEKGLKASMDSTNPRKRKAISKGKVKEPPSSSPSNATMVVEVNEKSSSKKCKVAESNENEKESVKNEDDSKKTESNSKPLEPPKDYIHVRARRGQATDSHSLAERVRREKISERMKLLQDLVPGCNKVTGKALMLDEIINYVQSLQHQVEFLSMKLASVNTRVDFNMDSLISKDMYQSGNPIDSSASTFYGQQNQALPSSSSYVAPRATPHCSVDPLDSVLCQNLGIQIPSLNPYSENVSQFPTFGEDDLQTIVQMGFVQNQNQEISLQSQNFNIGSEKVSQMKIEL